MLKAWIVNNFLYDDMVLKSNVENRITKYLQSTGYFVNINLAPLLLANPRANAYLNTSGKLNHLAAAATQRKFYDFLREI